MYAIVIYFIYCPGVLFHASLCFVSDDNKNDTDFVHEVKTLITDYINKYPVIENLYYFFDGCARQYKKYTNHIDLYHHE